MAKIMKEDVLDAVAVAVQALAKARGLLVEAQDREQLHAVARELERVRELAGGAYELACGLCRQVGD